MRLMSISTLRNLSRPVLNNLLTDGEEITITSGSGKNKMFVAILMPYERYARIGIQLGKLKELTDG